MKKLWTLVLALTMVLSMAACGGSTGDSSDSGSSGSSDVSSEAGGETPVTLVVGNVATGDENPYNMAMNWA